jgi:WD40 repeat protein
MLMKTLVPAVLILIWAGQPPRTWTSPSPAEEDRAERGLKMLQDKLSDAKKDRSEFAAALTEFRRDHPGTQAGRRAAVLLTALPSPLDGLALTTPRGASLPPETIAILAGHQRAVASIGFSPDGIVLASTGWDNELLMWKIAAGTFAPWAKLKSSPSELMFSPDGRSVAAGGAETLVQIWNIEGDKPRTMASLPGHTYRPFSLGYTPNGKMLVSGCFDPMMRFWDLRGKEPDGWALLTNDDSPAYHVAALSVSADGTWLATGSALGKRLLRLWHLEGVLMDEVDIPSIKAQLVAFSPIDNTLALHDEGSIHLWDVSKPKPREPRQLAAKNGRLNALAWGPDGKKLATAGKAGAAAIWDVASGKQIREWTLPVEPKVLAFAPDGRHLAIGCADGAICVLRLGA